MVLLLAIIGLAYTVYQAPWSNPPLSTISAVTVTLDVVCPTEHLAVATAGDIEAMDGPGPPHPDDPWHNMAASCLYATYRLEGLTGHDHVRGFGAVAAVVYESGVVTLHMEDATAMANAGMLGTTGTETLQFPWTGDEQVLSECDGLVCSERIVAADDGEGAIELCIPASGRDGFWDALHAARTSTADRSLDMGF